MHDKVERCHGLANEDRHGQIRDFHRIAQAAVGHDAGDAAHHETGHENATARRAADLASRVHDENLAGRRFLDGAALGVIRPPQDLEHVDILAARDVAQCEGLADHRQRLRTERLEATHEHVAQAALEQHCCDGRGADLTKSRAGGLIDRRRHGALPGIKLTDPSRSGRDAQARRIRNGPYL